MLVIACPHALGLAIPLVIAISSALAARRRHPDQGPPRAGTHATIDAVLFDKTGTLTKGEHVVTGVAGADGLRGRGAAARRRRRGRQRAPPGARPSSRPRQDRGDVAPRRGVPVAHRPGRRGRSSTGTATPSAARPCSASADCGSTDELQTRVDELDATRRRGPVPARRTTTSDRRARARGRDPARGPRGGRRAAATRASASS